MKDDSCRIVEMFKVRMQGQYGNPEDKRLRVVVSEMWSLWGFRKGVMRGFWVGQIDLKVWKIVCLLIRLLQVTVAREIPAYAGYVCFRVLDTGTQRLLILPSHLFLIDSILVGCPPSPRGTGCLTMHYLSRV